MGWVNYVKIPKLKMLIEVSRHLNDVLNEGFNTDINKEKSIDLDKKYDELSINDLYELIKYYGNSTKIFDNDELLLYWLKSRNLKYEVINEFEYDNNKDEYKDWTMIEK